MTLLQQMTAAKQAATAAALSEYDDLAKRLAHDVDETNADEIEAILSAAGKTLEQLERQVESYKARAQEVAKLIEGQAAIATRPDLEAKIEAALAVLRKAEQVYRQTVTPLNFKIQELCQLSIDMQILERRLFDSCRDQSLVARARQNRQEASEAAAQVRKALRAIEDAEALLGRAKERRDRDGIATYSQRLERNRAALTAARAAEAAAVADAKAIYDAMTR